MINAATPSPDGPDKRYEVATFSGAISHMISPAPDERSPQAFLVHQAPDSVIPLHFHDQHQFQVVARGAGTMGRHALKPFAVHYASPEAAYGPITSSSGGLDYFTLRAVPAIPSRHLHVPGVRESMRRGLRKRQVTTHAPDLYEPAALASLREAAMEILIAPEPSGLAAWLLRVPPHAQATAPMHAGSAGRYYVVANGSIQIEGVAKPRLSVVWVSPDEEPFRVAAGAEGLEALVLQFPADAVSSG